MILIPEFTIKILIYPGFPFKLLFSGLSPGLLPAFHKPNLSPDKGNPNTVAGKSFEADIAA